MFGHFFAAAILLVSVTVAANPAQQGKKNRKPQSTPATQAVQPAGKVQAQAPSYRWQQILTDRVSVGAIFSTAAAFTGVSGRKGDRPVAVGDMNTTEGFGVVGQYRYAFDPKIDATVGLQLQQRRQLTGFSQVQGKMQDNPEFMPLIAEVGITVKPNQFVYLPFGINTTVYNDYRSGSWDSMTMTPALGFQAGVGGRINRSAAIELLYQSVAYDFEAKGFGNETASGTAKLEGFALVGRYLF